jgi:two-component system OmpR family response regulator
MDLVMDCNEPQPRVAQPLHVLTKSLLVVDDDDEIRELLCDYLSETGYHVLAAADGREMWQQLETGRVSLVVLDVTLPGEDGLSLCRQLKRTSHLGVIMLSAKGSTFDRIIGLEVGADDYLAKPFEPRELVARIKAVLRRPGAGPDKSEQPDAIARFASFELDHVTRQLSLPAGSPATLPRSDYKVLRELLAARNQVLSRDQLTRIAMGRDYHPDDRSVDMCISRLRQHLRDCPDEAVQILTIRNEGYVLTLKACHEAL